MREQIVITDVTQMPDWDIVCVVGITNKGESIRPVCDGGFKKSYQYIGSELIVVPGVKIEFDFIRDKHDYPHIEDKVFDPNNIKFIEKLDARALQKVLMQNSYDSVQQIFNGNLVDDKYVYPGAQTGSIGTLAKVDIIKFYIDFWGKNKPKLLFIDGAQKAYDLPINDLSIRNMCRNVADRENEGKYYSAILKSAKRILLRIGLARPWAKSDSSEALCYPQVTAIYTFDNEFEVT